MYWLYSYELVSMTCTENKVLGNTLSNQSVLVSFFYSLPPISMCLRKKELKYHLHGLTDHHRHLATTANSGNAGEGIATPE